MDNLAAVRMLRKRLPDVASPRVLRWKIRLGAYNFTVEHRPAARHQNADALSRCPDGRRLALSTSDLDKDVVAGSYFLTPVGNDEYHLSLTAAVAPGEVARATAADPLLQDVLRFVQACWPARCLGERFQPYFRIWEALTVVRDCLMYGDRVVIPASLILAVRQAIQDLHVGLGKASVVCRLYLWFPGWKTAVKDAVRSCTSCQLTRPNPPHDRTASWPPAGPWERLHVDFGELDNRTFVVIFTPERAMSSRIGQMAQRHRRPSACCALRSARMVCARLLSLTMVQPLPPRISTPFYVTAASPR